MNKRLFDDNWEFMKVLSCEENTEWKRVDIPHDWHIYSTDELYQDGEGWYRKYFTYSGVDERVFIRFDGVYMDCTVWVNEKLAGVCKYGYSTFELEITNLLTTGMNEIKVRTVFKNPNSRWYSGAGIYRHVWLITKPNTCLVSDGTYVSTQYENDTWNVNVDSEVDFSNDGQHDNYKIIYTLMKENCADICKEVTTDNFQPVECTSENNVMKAGCFFTIKSPDLWDIESPDRYILLVRLFCEGIFIDSDELKFGFRSIEFGHETGFSLNGRHVKIHGVCMHHDLGCLGAAFNDTALRRQLRILKQMGVNAIRTSHNMPAPELIEAADSMGFLVDDEAFDMWERSKTAYDYSRFFKEWAETDIRSFVRRDRNHPCIIMWSIGNEIYDTHADEHGQVITKMLMQYVHNNDYRGNAPVTIGSNYMPWENAQKCADIVKLAGYNYGEHCYNEHFKQHNDWVIYGSETASLVQSRGIYHFPEDIPILDEDDLQCSSLGNSSTSWGARSHEDCIADDRDATFSAGMFIWSGIDYIGEPTPYHTKNSYFGQIDTAGFPKDSYYLYQAEWTDYRKSPMVHLFPYWDFNTGQIIDILVCSNAPEVELFFNDISLGRQSIDHKHGRKLFARWKKSYEKGKLVAVAYDENNNIIASDEKSSFGDAKQIVLKADKTELKADGCDLVFVEISANDAAGNHVYNATNRINISVKGAGRLVGIDNGDSTDYDSYKGSNKRLFSGKLLAIIAAKTKPGLINISVTSPGLIKSDITLNAIHSQIADGISAIEENSNTQLKKEIPVRKIEIITTTNILTNECRETDAVAVIYPADSTYREVSWKVTDNRGVNSNIAKITTDGSRVHIEALGDGDFRLRCMSMSGTKHAEIISQLEFHVSGIGPAFVNPYEFVSGSWYSDCEGDITCGNERGIATSRENATYLLYDNLDFGDYGSDKVHIPIFELDSKPLEFEIWTGMPYVDGSKKLIDACYNKKSIWNQYQEEEYLLPYRLKGLSSLGFAFNRKAHIKGFYFTKIQKAFERLSAVDNNAIYGDDYIVKDDAVEHIGNNVSLVYDNMDFGSVGINRINVCGRTSLDNNTINIIFKFENGDENTHIIEFAGSNDYLDRVFDIETVKGRCQVIFVFLPGSNFDFKWFMFS